MLTVSCNGPSGREPSADAGDPAIADLQRAKALALPSATLPERPEVLALAQSIEGRARKEGSGVRAVELHTVAASLLERIWRIEAREQDAKEAVDLYREAARDPGMAGACEAAVLGARLAGEAAHDAGVTYAELYRAQRRFSSPQAAAVAAPCVRAIEDELSALAAFRPAARVLEAIDDGLVGEGAIPATSVADAGAPRVRVGGRIVNIEQWPGKDAARVVLVLDRTAKYRIGDEVVAGGPPQSFVELEGVDIGSVPRDLATEGIVTHIRTSATSTGVRVALQLDGPAYRRDFHLPEPFRVVIDIARHPPSASPRGRRTVSRVVVDPGHGGSDPGATGQAGLREKDVTLDIAHRVAPVLAREGMQIVLTRDDDRFISLEERTARANAFGADLFVSIHCNAAPAESRGRRGVETYVLDTTRDEIANRVAARENATSQAASAEVSSLLASMRMADQATRSERLAELLQRASLASLRMTYPDVHDGHVQHAGFYVLVGARMPAVLFETSYISNATEESRLATDEYKQRLADGIVNAVKAYREGR